jgi:glycosyltransferase involved in cell wall biosynthesis
MMVFVHLLNDRSGSPRILKNVIDATLVNGNTSLLYIGTDGDGVLSDSGLEIKKYWYWRTGNKLGTLFTYFFSQFILFFKLFTDRTIVRNAEIYVNTLLPFGAALYGWVTRRKVVYHIHEISITPAPLKWLLVGVNKLTSSLNLYVSDCHIQGLPIPGVPARRIYNALDADFASKAAESVYKHRRDGKFNVLMIASLRDYKGVAELFALASSFLDRSDVHFDLVLNDDPAAIKNYCDGKYLPPNLTLHTRVTDTKPYYGKASLVLNLSRVDLVTETFGMTVLEAMAFGVPVIVPPVGGPSELVTDSVEGFLVDSRYQEELFNKVNLLVNDELLCSKLSSAARSRAADFSYEEFAKNIRQVFEEIKQS